jgi:hypothetical protein
MLGPPARPAFAPVPARPFYPESIDKSPRLSVICRLVHDSYESRDKLPEVGVVCHLIVCPAYMRPEHALSGADRPAELEPVNGGHQCRVVIPAQPGAATLAGGWWFSGPFNTSLLLGDPAGCRFGGRGPGSKRILGGRQSPDGLRQALRWSGERQAHPLLEPAARTEARPSGDPHPVLDRPGGER